MIRDRSLSGLSLPLILSFNRSGGGVEEDLPQSLVSNSISNRLKLTHDLVCVSESVRWSFDRLQPSDGVCIDDEDEALDIELAQQSPHSPKVFRGKLFQLSFPGLILNGNRQRAVDKVKRG